MPRIKFPENFSSQRKLLKNIIIKVNADGTSSPLIAFFTKKRIVLADDAIAGSKADVQEKARLANHKSGINFIELRDKDFGPVMRNIRGELQFLKLWAKPNYRELGSWGATISAKGKIVYSPNFSANTDLFKAIFTQNASYTSGTSPLFTYLTKKEISMTDDEAAVTDSKKNHKKGEVAMLASQKAMQNRIGFWKIPLEHLHLICEYLMILYKGNERMLGAYGITVTYNKIPAKLRKSSLKPLMKRTIKGVLIGSVLTNIGAVDVLIYKGATISGIAKIVMPGEVLNIKKGYSTLTIVNPSSLENSKITVKVSNS